MFSSIYANDTDLRDWAEEWYNLPLLFNRSDSFQGTVVYENIKFVGFKDPLTYCGSRQAALGPYWRQPDYVPLVRVKNPTFKDFVMDALAYFPKPLTEWATFEDCGNFPCTGLLNSVAVIENGQSDGVALPNGGNFAMISGNSDFKNFETHVGDSISECTWKEDWGGY